MNSLESYITLNPYEKTDECAKFTIDDITDKFVLSDVIIPGEKYMLSFWIKSETPGNLVFQFNDYPTSSKWIKYNVPVDSIENYLLLSFSVVGTYYIYHLKLETGDKVTDWSPAPEDTEDSITSLNSKFATLNIGLGEIKSTVSTLSSSVNGINGQITNVNEQISSLQQTSSRLDINFQNINTNGVSRVVTETGFTFDREGMTVDASDSETKTQVATDGMTVYKKDKITQKTVPVLEATSEGVAATDLQANTFLIIGGKSRFETIENNRTACFWIGG